MAGALGLALAGPRVYGGVTVEDAGWATAAANGRRRYPQGAGASTAGAAGLQIAAARPSIMLALVVARGCWPWHSELG